MEGNTELRRSATENCASESTVPAEQSADIFSIFRRGAGNMYFHQVHPAACRITAAVL